MRNVRNNKAIRRLSKQSFRANRTRNLVASIAIALTAILFTAVFTVGLGLIENAQRSAMQQAGGDMHGSIKDISEKQYQIFKRHRLIQECGRGILVADAVENPEFLKRHVEMHFIDKNLYPHWFLNIVEGTAPSKADEILIDEKSMELLGMQPKAGCEITLQVKIGQNSKSIERTFRVSGVIQASAAMNVGFVFVSDAYLDEYQEELKQCAEDITSNAGKITMDVMFQHAGDIQRKLNQVITDSGFSVDESSENYIASNANWAYFYQRRHRRSAGYGGDGRGGGFDYADRISDYLQYFSDFHYSGYPLLWSVKNDWNDRAADETDFAQTGRLALCAWDAGRPSPRFFCRDVFAAGCFHRIEFGF